MADKIIFLDTPLWKRRYSILLRYIKQQLLIEKCPYKSDLKMLKKMQRNVYTMNYIIIKGEKYDYAVNYKENHNIRRSFNSLTRKTYGFDFEQWYQDGYWQKNYIPYSLLDGDTMVANVSVSIMDFLVLGEKKRYIQIGTVMTHKDYRNQGLSRLLIENIISEWEYKCELIYLFANDSVLNFYPKFGFVPVKEYQCAKSITLKDISDSAIKLNMSDENDRKLLYNKCNNSLTFSKIAMQENTSLVMFYCTSFMSDNVFYIKDFDAVVIAALNKGVLYLQDVFCSQVVSLDNIINSMSNKNIKKVVLGFMPKDISSYEINLLQKEDTTLFVRTNKSNIFDNHKLMFPILSHA